MRPDMLGEWLPLALADLLIGLASIFGRTTLKQSDVLKNWGLPTTESDEIEEQSRIQNVDTFFDSMEKR
jgi:hypothetical protein